MRASHWRPWQQEHARRTNLPELAWLLARADTVVSVNTGIMHLAALTGAPTVGLHGATEFANKHSHINGIESFWAFAKTRLVRFRGLHRHTFYFHLKECEFRFNYRQDDIGKIILKMLRE